MPYSLTKLPPVHPDHQSEPLLRAKRVSLERDIPGPVVSRRPSAVVLGDQPLGEELGEKGLAQAAKFSWERTARETLAVYRQVVTCPPTDNQVQ